MEKKGPNVQSGEIVFRPLTEGLGFHPFSDGLPYAPMSKTPRNTRTQGNLTGQVPSSLDLRTGAGAVKAGPPVFVKAPQVATPVAPKISVPVAHSTHQAVHHKSLQGARQLPTQKLNRPSIEIEYGWNYMSRRMTAYCIDFVFNSLLFFSSIAFFLFVQDSSLDLLSSSRAIYLTVIAWFLFHWVFVSFQELFFKSSIGKRVVGLSLKGRSIQLFARSLLFIPSLVLFGIGLLAALFDRRKRCWHDRLAGVQPIDR